MLIIFLSLLSFIKINGKRFNQNIKIAVAEAAMYEDRPETLKNAERYCARHGYDYIDTNKAYKLIPYPNGASTCAVANYELVRQALPYYDWIFTK